MLTSEKSTIPADDLQRKLVLVRPETDDTLLHLGVVGDTYTIVLTGEDTAGRYCLIDMHIPPGGGPPRIAMISRRRLWCWWASWRLCSAG